VDCGFYVGSYVKPILKSVYCADFAGITLASAISMATVNPARLFEGISGKLEKGQQANLVLFKAQRKKIRSFVCILRVVLYIRHKKMPKITIALIV
jgi:N-acetylglucosamine-6-phosphate deacetylase